MNKMIRKINNYKENHRKGFTLIELLAVIIVLAMLALIVVPIANKQISSSKSNLYLNQVTLIEKAAKEWGNDNQEKLPIMTDDYTYVSIGELKESNLIDRNIVKDPRTNKTMNGCVSISYSETYHQNSYDYVEKPCSELNGGGAPTIIVEGGTPQGIEVNTKYQLPNISAKDSSGKELAVDGPVIRNPQNKVVDEVLTTNIRDVYSLTYRSLDSIKNKETEKIVNVKVIDTTPPVIVVNGKADSHTVTTEAGSGFTVPTPVVTDNSKIACSTASGSKCLIGINSNVNTSVLGTYRVVYTATDDGEDLAGSRKNTSAYTLTVKVIDTTPPVVNSITASTTSWTNRDVTLTINSTDFIGVTDYSFDNGSTWQKSNQRSYSGNQTVTVRTKDGSGNISQPKSYTISNIDKIAPTCATSGGTSGWTASNVTIYGTCSDTGGSTCTTNISRPIYGTTVSPYDYSPGTVYDTAGNSAVCPATKVYIDQVAPSVPTISNNSNGAWVNWNVTVESTANDGHSGMSRIEYSYDKNTIIPFGASETVNAGHVRGLWTAERNNTVYIRAVDNVGNASGWASTTIRIDKTPPITYINYDNYWNGYAVIINNCGATVGTRLTETSSKYYSMTQRYCSAVEYQMVDTDPPGANGVSSGIQYITNSVGGREPNSKFTWTYDNYDNTPDYVTTPTLLSDYDASGQYVGYFRPGSGLHHGRNSYWKIQVRDNAGNVATDSLTIQTTWSTKAL